MAWCLIKQRDNCESTVNGEYWKKERNEERKSGGKQRRKKEAGKWVHRETIMSINSFLFTYL
jgi:hypothetical protein